MFRVVQKLQELFKAGTVRLSGGTGAYALYQFDRREVLRYTQRDRLAAYRRVLGYGARPGAAGRARRTPTSTSCSRTSSTRWRSSGATSGSPTSSASGPTTRASASIAVVRRAGLDLRNNLKFTSFGHLNVLRVEVMQLLDEAFRILELRRHQAAVRRRQRVGRRRGGAHPLLQRAARHLAAAAHGAWPAARCCAGWPSRTSSQSNAAAVRGAAARDRRVRRGMAHERPVDGSGAARGRTRAPPAAPDPSRPGGPADKRASGGTSTLTIPVA